MKRFDVLTVVLVLAVGVLGAPAHAAAPTYVWSIDGSVSYSGLPAGVGPGVPLGPNVSSAKDGTKIEIAGSGHLSPKDRWIDGGGDYRILDAKGKVLASGRFKPTALTSYQDTGTEPEGLPVETLRAGVILAPIALQGLGTGSLDLECGQHAAGGELEGVRLIVRGWRFTHIDQGSTTIERQ